MAAGLLVLSCGAVALAQAPRIPLSRDQLILLAKDPVLRQRPDMLMQEWIKPNKIGFLPTASVRRQLEEAGVPATITAELPRHFGSTLWLKVFEYACLGCGADSRAGRDFAQQVSNAEAAVKLRREQDPVLRTLLGGKSFDPIVETLTAGWQPPLHQQPMAYIHGTLERDGETYRLTSQLSYRSITDAGPVGPNLTKVVPATPAALRGAAEEAAAWVLETLRAALQ